MSRCTRSIRKLLASPAGLSTLELVISVGIISIAMAATSGLFLAGRNFMRDQTLDLETSQAARATIDLLLRELRLGGACLPVTGDFVSLDGADDGQRDSITSRTGLTRPDLSCVSSATSADVAAGATVVPVGSVNGFVTGRRGYIRHPAGTGEYFEIVAADASTNEITINPGLSVDYPVTSGVYEIDERSFGINDNDPQNPVLEMRIDDGPPSKLATGIERLDIQYQLRRNCPNCDVVDIPADNPEWSIVEQVFLEVTARSQRPGPSGDYYRRTIRVGVKPRNLLPRT